MLEGYLVHILIIIGIYIILATSLNLSLGYTGLLNLGHIAFFGIGAYVSALLTKEFGLPFLVAFFSAGVFASVFGLVLIFATKKIKGDYLALATFGFSLVMYSIFLNWTSLTRGPLGIPGISKPVFFGYRLGTNVEYLLFVAIVTGIVVYILKRITGSRYGKLLEAVRDDEVGVSVYGKDVFKLKNQSMVLSAFFSGIAGSLFAHYITFIDPSSFHLNEIILVITIVLVGGLATLKGSIMATFIIIIIPELLRFISLPSSIIGPARQIIYALVLIGIIMLRPKGLLGKIDLE